MDANPNPNPSPNPASILNVLSYLRVRGAGHAIDFYRAAFGAVERFRLVEPSGRIGHAELQLGPSLLRLSEEFPEFGWFGPRGPHDDCAAIHLHVDDVDKMAERAVAAGAHMLKPPSDQNTPHAMKIGTRG